MAETGVETGVRIAPGMEDMEDEDLEAGEGNLGFIVKH